MTRRLLMVLLTACLGACSNEEADAARQDPTETAPEGAATMLWNGARSGMSPDQIKGLFPAVERSPRPETLYGGARSELSWREADVFGRPAQVDFFFLPGAAGLQQVMARPSAATRQASPENLALAHGLVETLKKTYGQPSECGDNPFGFDCIWRSDGVEVALTLIQSSGRTTIFNISFRPSLNRTERQ
jgi:hypothetical protein